MSGPATAARTAEVAWTFLRLGLGLSWRPPPWPDAFRQAVVVRRAWVSDDDFDEDLALARALPGARSAHLAMALGRRRAGYGGMAAAWIAYLAPVAFAAVALALLFPRLDDLVGEDWRRGLMLAAAGLTLKAVIDMARRQAADPLRAGMAIGAGAGLLIARGPVSQIWVLAAGAAFGLVMLRGARTEPESAPEEPAPRDFWIAVAALGLFIALLGGLPFLAARLGGGHLALASVLYRAGALAFGGQAMSLPLVYREVAYRGWLDRESLAAGLGALQALPGPLTALGGFAGAAQQLTGGGWTTGLIGLAAVFAPGALLTLGALPFWPALSKSREIAGAAAGLAAVAVGSVAAAWWLPLIVTAVRAPVDWLMVFAAWMLPAFGKIPPWIVVVGLAALTLFVKL
jgi:chromate transporter